MDAGLRAESGRGGAGRAIGNGFRGLGVAIVWGVAIALPLMVPGVLKLRAVAAEREAARAEAVARAEAYERLIAAPALPAIAEPDALAGREVFMTTCAACHGPEGRGVVGLGLPLTTSDFVAYTSDDDLVRFIVQGRPDARPVAMPPKAGRDDLTTEDMRHVVAYVRGLQDPRRMPVLPAWQARTAGAAEKAAALAAAGGDEELAAYIASGDAIFHSMCVACHGRGGVGVPGNGKPLVNNAFVQSLDDDALLEFITRGRSPTDPKNTTGIQMPPKGGNPAMTEDDILDVIAYLRTLQGK
jgi:disulfide bond formation protein DsbB